MKKSVYNGLYLVIAILLVLPFVLPNSFYLDLAVRMAINAVIVLGLNLLIGFAGQISLGHADKRSPAVEGMPDLRVESRARTFSLYPCQDKRNSV